MEQATQTEHVFRGVRLQIDTPLTFDEVLDRLNKQTGAVSLTEVNELGASGSTQQFEDAVNSRFAGPSGFMRFSQIEHTRWIGTFGIHRRVLRIILGNPLIAITMLREDISAGLFAPVEMLLVENQSGARVDYVRPSSLILIRENPALEKAALELDTKLARLVAAITGFSS